MAGRQENLTPWKPGQSGNPAGKPKGAKHSVRSVLRRLMAKNAPDHALEMLQAKGYDLEEASCREALAIVLYEKAIRGDVRAAQELLKQVEDPIPSKVELTGANGDPLFATVDKLSDEEVSKLIDEKERQRRQSDQ